MDFESMVRELIENRIPASLVGGVIIITNPDTGEQMGLSTNIPEDVDIFRNIHAQYVPEDEGRGIVGGAIDAIKGLLPGGEDNEPNNATGQPSPPNQGEGQELSEQDKNLAESIGWDFDKHGALPPLRDWKNDAIPGTIDWPLVETLLNQIIRADDRSIVEEERERAAKARYDTRADAQAAADLRNQTDPGWLVTHEPTTDYYYIYKDFKPRFSVDAQGNQIMQTTEGGVWEIVEQEEKYIPRTIEEYELQLLREGRYDEAAKLDQIVDQLRSERMTPERAAEMLINIAHNPVDFKDMMDAILGRDSEIDTSTSDIQMLQAQSAAMLLDDRDPVLANALPRAVDLRTGSVSSEAQEFPSSGSYDPSTTMNPKINPILNNEIDPYPVTMPDKREFDRLRAVDRNLIESGVPIAGQGLMPEGIRTSIDDEKIFNKPYDYRKRAVDRDLISAKGSMTQGTYLPTEYQEGLGPILPTFVQPGHPAWAILEASKRRQAEAEAKAKSDALDETYRKMYSKTNYPGSMDRPYESTEARLDALRPFLEEDTELFDINKRKQRQQEQKRFKQQGITVRSWV